MKGFKKILFVFLGVMIAFFLFLLWYQNRYAMDVVTPYTINETQFGKKLLIATQGSDFKHEVTTGIANHFKSDSISIQVIDIKQLKEIAPQDYDVLVVIHTWEYGEPPAAVNAFLDKTITKKDKIIVLTTSGEGSYKTENIDAIAGESILENAPVIVAQLIGKIEVLLKMD